MLIHGAFKRNSLFNSTLAIRLFLRLCEQQSFSKVAKSAGLDVSTVSRTLQLLEEALQVKLFHSTTRQVVITPMGLKLKPQFAEMIKKFDKSVYELQASCSGDADDVIYLAGPACFNENLLNRWAMQFAASHPGIRFHLRLTDLALDPEKEGFDIALLSGSAVGLRDNTIQLGCLTSCIAASPLYLEKHGEPTHPDQLQKHVLLGYKGRMGSSLFRLIHDGRIHSYRFQETLQASSTTALARAVLDGFGILTYACHFMFHEAIEKGELVEILTDWKQPETIVQAVINPSSMHRPAVKEFLEFIQKKWPVTPGLFRTDS